jgi:hypothetical protein
MPPARYANTPIIQTSNSFPHKYRRAKQLINNCSIVERRIIEEMDEVMEEEEVRLFDSKNLYL